MNKVLSKGDITLSENEKAYIKVVDKQLGDDFIGVHIFPTHSVSSSFQKPINGATFQYKATANAHPNLFNEHFAGQLLCSEIEAPLDKNQLLNEQYFISRKNNLLSIPEYDSNGIALDVLHADKSYDNRPWKATLGKNGKVYVYMIRGQQGCNKYYLIVQSDSGKAGKDLKAFLKTRNSDYNMHKFKKSREYYKTCDLSRRNARRIMKQAADLLGVSLNVDISEDYNAVKERPTEQSPLLVNPNVSNEYNVLDSDCTGKTISYYSATTPSHKAVNGLFHVADNTLEMNLYHANQAPSQKVTNEYASSFSPFTSQQPVADSIKPHVKSFINERMVWDNKEKSDAFHPSVYSKYTPITPQDRQHNAEYFGAKYGHEHLYPVIARLSSLAI